MLGERVTNNRAYKGTIYAAEELVKRERILGPVYDPTRQDDGIIEVLLKNGNSTFHTSRNFLTYDCHYPNVITEPHPHCAVVWAYRALEIASDKVAFLLPANFIETAEIKELVDKTPLARVYIITKHLPLRKGGYAWFVWVKGHFEPPLLRWI